MIKLVNNSDRRIDLTTDISIPANKSFEGNLEITPRINQMIQMGILTKIDITYNETDYSNFNLTEGAKRRRATMEKIKAGLIKESIPLNFKDDELKTTVKSTRKRK